MKDSHIQWTDHTFNPWIGCTKVSPGCLHCYAEAMNVRWKGGKNWGKGAPRQRTSEANWREPIKWSANAMVEWVGQSDWHRPRVFCASLADWLDDEVPIEWLVDLLQLIRITRNLNWLLLTKRPENWRVRLQDALAFSCKQASSTPGSPGLKWDGLNEWLMTWNEGTAPANVWIGTTVEDQARSDERIPKLLEIPAKVRFLSCEPLLSAIEFSDVTRRADSVAQLGQKALKGIHWVIDGGESGPSARPYDLRWSRSLEEQCRAAGVAYFRKQLGARPIMGDMEPTGQFRTNPKTGRRQLQVRADVLNLKDRAGGDWDEWPEDLRVREFPKVEVPA